MGTLRRRFIWTKMPAVAQLTSMPDLVLPADELRAFGKQWIDNGKKLSRSAPHSSIQLGNLVDENVAAALAVMLGDISVRNVSARGANQLYPPEADCVERGEVAIVGGIRKQQFDVAYRPDGARFAFDSKTLNDADSVGKNWQNMVNDLATEAATVHTRFPMAVVGFVVLIPAPAARAALDAMTWRLDGLGSRTDEHGPAHIAEAMCLAIWEPSSGKVSPKLPDPALHPGLRIENFSRKIEDAYRMRFAGSPPH
jgi:hypothetical protein